MTNTAAEKPYLAGLRCGDEAWSMAATEWITSSEVLDSIENFKTKVWIYRNSEQDGSMVGFSSLATTGWRKWPPPDGKRSRLLYIPQLGLDQRYRGFPPDLDWRYSNQIMKHLIGEAKKYALQIQVDKPPSKHVDLLTLKVHRQNIAAQKLYNRYSFDLLDGFEDKEHLMTFHKLDLEGQLNNLLQEHSVIETTGYDYRAWHSFHPTLVGLIFLKRIRSGRKTICAH